MTQEIHDYSETRPPYQDIINKETIGTLNKEDIQSLHANFWGLFQLRSNHRR